MYKDYPINVNLLHWESQSGTICLFVRLKRTNGPLTAPFQFLGRG